MSHSFDERGPTFSLSFNKHANAAAGQLWQVVKKRGVQAGWVRREDEETTSPLATVCRFCHWNDLRSMTLRLPHVRSF